MVAYFSIAVGLYLAIGALVKPNFFWNSKKAIRLRNSFGDSMAVKIYLGISAFAFVLGIIEMF